MKELKVRLTLKEELLGSQPTDKEIHENFIAAKAPDAASREEEIAAIGVDAEVEKTMTVFHRHDGKPCLMDYQIRGFFKSAAKAFNNMTEKEVELYTGMKLKKLSAFNKKIDLLIFVEGVDGGRFIPIVMPEGAEIGSCQRPLRGQTAQGERISLANSETVPAGTTLEFKIQVLSHDLSKYVDGWLKYGRLNGLGQWRNSGKGAFTFEKIEDWQEVEG